MIRSSRSLKFRPFLGTYCGDKMPSTKENKLKKYVAVALPLVLIVIIASAYIAMKRNGASGQVSGVSLCVNWAHVLSGYKRQINNNDEENGQYVDTTGHVNPMCEDSEDVELDNLTLIQDSVI